MKDACTIFHSKLVLVIYLVLGDVGALKNTLPILLLLSVDEILHVREVVSMCVQKRVGVQRVRSHQASVGNEGFPNLSSKKFKELPELLVQPQLADVRTVGCFP